MRMDEWLEDSDMSRHYGPNRYVCSVLEEMRDQVKLLNHDNLDRYINNHKMMIEEVQTLVNRMESALQDWGDLEGLTKEKRELKLEIKKLRLKRDKLKLETGADDAED
jgi:hypothetical protein